MINNYLQNCDSTTAGNDRRIFVAPYGAIDSVTFDGENKVTAIDMINTGATFAELQADWDSVGFEREGEAARSFVSTQTLTASFTNLNAELITLMEQLRGFTVCGLVILRKDGQGRYFLSGYAPVEKSAQNRPYTRIEDTFNTGTEITEVDEANRQTINFIRTSGTEEYMLDESLAATMDAKTADFVNFN